MDAWKQLKLMRAYEHRKKLEMMGAMVLSSAAATRRGREDSRLGNLPGSRLVPSLAVGAL